MITDPQDSENDKIIEETPKTLTLSEQDRIKILVVHVCEDVPENFAKNIQKLTDLIIQYSQNT